MGLLRSNYNKPGPGVPKDAPPKTGASRFLEVLLRDCSSLFRLNLLMFLAAALPHTAFSLAMGYGASGRTWIAAVLLIAGLAASLFSGPVFSASARLVTQMLRDTPGFFWSDFKKSFRLCVRETALPGLLAMLGGYSLSAALWAARNGVGFSLGAMCAVAAAALSLAGILACYGVQACYLKLGVRNLLKNSLLIFFGNAPRCLLGSAAMLLPMSALYLFLPLSLPLWLLGGLSLPLLGCMMCVWPVMDGIFGIDREMKRMLEEELGS